MSTASTTFDPHSFEMFIEYQQLKATTLGEFLLRIGQVTDQVSMKYGEQRGLSRSALPSLTISEADTSNSIKLTFGEGWLPNITSDEEHDIIVSVPKKLGIPLIVGYLLLNGTSKLLDMRNDYLDSQIKLIELQLKESELNETLFGDTEEPVLLEAASVEATRRLLRDEDVTSLQVRGIDLVAILRKEDENKIERERGDDE
jgi:hypothetical protein